jgi:hypothetical protein
VCYILTLTSLRAVLRVRQDTAVIKSLLMSYVDLSKAPKVVKTLGPQKTKEAASFCVCACVGIERKKIYIYISCLLNSSVPAEQTRCRVFTRFLVGLRAGAACLSFAVFFFFSFSFVFHLEPRPRLRMNIIEKRRIFRLMIFSQHPPSPLKIRVWCVPLLLFIYFDLCVGACLPSFYQQLGLF